MYKELFFLLASYINTNMCLFTLAKPEHLQHCLLLLYRCWRLQEC